MESEQTAPLKLKQERIVKEDGRYLIYFTFDTPPTTAQRSNTAPTLESLQTSGDRPNV